MTIDQAGSGMRMRRLPATEIIHYLEGADQICSIGNCFTFQIGGRCLQVEVPQPARLRLPLLFRLSRRALRLDKGNAAVTADGSSGVIVYRGVVHHLDLTSGTLTEVMRLRQCRNLLHGALLRSEGRTFLFGEYGANPRREPVNVYRSEDGGRSWKVIHVFAAGEIRHVHGIYEDPYTGHYWVTTGDFEGECRLYEFDREFSLRQRHGDGSQLWRTVGLFFRSDRIVWAMDSELEVSHLVTMDRATGRVARGRSFPGPVWYAKDLQDGVALLTTSCEVGPGVLSDRSHLFASVDLEDWQEVWSRRHDGLPRRYLKYGVLSFADGLQTSTSFALFGEALRGFDGEAGVCGLSIDALRSHPGAAVS